MFDINTAINAAIETAVQERFTEMAQQYANNMGAMAERIAELETKLHALDMLVLNGAKPFVEKLNSQEWFWDKINAYVDEHMERRDGESISIDNFPELFAIEFNRKAGSEAVLSREEVAEIVKELWDEDYESEVQDIVDRAVEDIDLSDYVRREVRDLSFSVSVD